MTDIKQHLATRRSVSIPLLEAPAPSGEELNEILRLATRVPDHGKLAPWRFLLLRGEPAAALSRQLVELAQRRESEPLSEARRAFEEERFTRAPLVIGVISTAKPHVKIPEWEQVLSAGAVTMNLVHAINAHGYSSNWITEWPAYDDEAKAILGIAPEERVAGFVYVGTAKEPAAERPRPALADIVSEAAMPRNGA